MKKKILISAISVIIVYIFINTISIYSFSLKDQKRKADVAIILGASTSNGTVSPVYQERLNHGIDLYREGYVDKLIVTGGIGEGNDQSDAYAAKQYAISQGIPATDILAEDTSTITQENLENSKTIMDQNEYSTAIIVSDPLHMRRAMLLAKDAGINAYSSPTQTSKYVSLKTQIPFLAREVFFYIGYKWWEFRFIYVIIFLVILFALIIFKSQSEFMERNNVSRET
ncbi:MAG: YdcF family protein [Lachnospiraceae bacterium]|nr:YdcF family protein [Lachnospiraceae bacterium]